jgi:hypothetical protein
MLRIFGASALEYEAVASSTDGKLSMPADRHPKKIAPSCFAAWVYHLDF